MSVTKRCKNQLLNLPSPEDNPKVNNFHDILQFPGLTKFVHTYQFSLESYWADSCVKVWKFSKVSGTDSVPHLQVVADGLVKPIFVTRTLVKAS